MKTRIILAIISIYIQITIYHFLDAKGFTLSEEILIVIPLASVSYFSGIYTEKAEKVEKTEIEKKNI